MIESRAPRKQAFALTAGVAIALSAMWLLVGPGLNPDPSRLYIEAERYLLMAGWGPGVELAEVNFPSRYRILTPLIVRLLPVDVPLGFQIFTGLCLAVFFLLLWLLSLELDLSRRQSSAGIALALSLFYPTVYYLHNPFMTDPLFFCLWAAGILAILKKRWLLLMLILAAGVLNKETIVFLAPACLFLWFDRKAALRSLGLVAVAFVPAVVAYLSLKSIYGYAGGQTSITPSFILNWAISTVLSPGYLRGFASGLLLAGAPLWIYIPVVWKSSSEQMKRYLVGGAFSVAPLLLLASDSGRELAKLAPFWIPFLLRGCATRFESESVWRIVAPAVAGNIILSIVTLNDMGRATETILRAAAVMLMMLPAAMIALAIRKKTRREMEKTAP